MRWSVRAHGGCPDCSAVGVIGARALVRCTSGSLPHYYSAAVNGEDSADWLFVGINGLDQIIPGSRDFNASAFENLKPEDWFLLVQYI